VVTLRRLLAATLLTALPLTTGRQASCRRIDVQAAEAAELPTTRSSATRTGILRVLHQSLLAGTFPGPHIGVPLHIRWAVAELPAVFETAGHRYSFERELGCGGMATVHLARDHQSGSLVAIKLLRSELISFLSVERFRREIGITSRLQHPNIIPVLDAGEADGLPFYVTPYIAGESLAQRLRRESQLPIPAAIDIACQVADALEVAHMQGFVHRDIKPGNILLVDGRAILADFGLARAVDVITAEQLTQSGVVVGTPAYMSPEQSSHARIDPRSDIYSLGCVIYEMLAGTPPFSGPTTQALLARHAVDPVPSLRTVRGTVSPELEQVVGKALAKVPADRYATAAELRDALRAAVGSGPHAPSATRTLVTRRVLRFTAAAVVVAAGLTWRSALSGAPELDRNRVMVFPLVAPPDTAARHAAAAGPTGPSTTGEDLATVIGGALDGAGPLRWIDGWSMLGTREREDIRNLNQQAARSLARSKQCGYFLVGRLVSLGDSVQVFLELKDVSGDSTLARGKAAGTANRVWALGLQAVNDLLPTLIPAGAPDIVSEWNHRKPAAIASFLLGEAAFRRLHLADALKHYRAAVKADSLFGLAAVRGAQAAVWSHRPEEAASLIDVAARQTMPPRYAHFTRGYHLYLAGKADSAAAEFRQAIRLDPEMTVAWIQLGEVYTHLLPERGDPISLAEAALEEAHRLDPSATTLLLHLIENRLRKGEIAQAQPLIRRFLAADPEPELAQQVRVMEACVEKGPHAVDWGKEAAQNILPVLAAGKLLAAGGAQLDCATAAFSAVIRADTSALSDSRWFALLQLQAILLARGRVTEAMEQVDRRPEEEVASVMYLLDAPVFPEISAKAAEVARRYKAECGLGYARCASPYRIWELGVWDADHGHTAESQLAARELTSRAGRADSQDAQLLAILGRSVAAHTALARSDTATALRLFATLAGDAVPGGVGIEWDVGKPLGLDRLRFAQLLLARNRAREALEVADMLDSTAPCVYLLYLPASLRLRLSAARAIGDDAKAAQYQSRLAALTSNRKLFSPKPAEGVT